MYNYNLKTNRAAVVFSKFTKLLKKNIFIFCVFIKKIRNLLSFLKYLSVKFSFLAQYIKNTKDLSENY